MYKCTKCQAEWETNYCPACSHTIDHNANESEHNIHLAEPTRSKTPVTIGFKPERYFPSSSIDDIKEKIAVTKHKMRDRIILGVGIASVGLLIIIVSYLIAKDAGGGIYFVTYGLIFAGILTVIRAIYGIVKIGKIEREIRRG